MYIRKNHWRPGLHPELPGPAGGADNATPQTLKLDPQQLTSVALAPYDSHLRHSSRIAVPKLWSP